MRYVLDRRTDRIGEDCGAAEFRDRARSVRWLKDGVSEAVDEEHLVFLYDEDIDAISYNNFSALKLASQYLAEASSLLSPLEDTLSVINFRHRLSRFFLRHIIPSYPEKKEHD